MTTTEALDELIAYAPEFSYIVSEQEQYTSSHMGGVGRDKKRFDTSIHWEGDCQLIPSRGTMEASLIEAKCFIDSKRKELILCKQ